tara:strand:+ start:1683 stop:1889 length:207 start_codon:yes stop_codon:yes gene_type:complete
MVIIQRKNKINGKKQLIGKFKTIKNILYFLDCYSNEWEEFNKDYLFILEKEEIKKLKKHLGNFKVLPN